MSITSFFLRWGIIPLLIALLYCITGQLGLFFSTPPGTATLLWPPSGLALASYMLYGSPALIGILFGSFFTNISVSFLSGLSGDGFFLAMVIGLASCLQTIIAKQLIQRYLPFPNAWENEKDIHLFLFLAGPCASITCSTIGVATLWSLGYIDTSHIIKNWSIWWLGDTFGILIFTLPLYLCFSPLSFIHQRRRLWIAVPFFMILLCLAIFSTFVKNIEYKTLKDAFTLECQSLSHSIERHFSDIVGSVQSVQLSHSVFPQMTLNDFQRIASPFFADETALMEVAWIKGDGKSFNVLSQKSATSSAQNTIITPKNIEKAISSPVNIIKKDEAHFYQADEKTLWIIFPLERPYQNRHGYMIGVLSIPHLIQLSFDANQLQLISVMLNHEEKNQKYYSDIKKTLNPQYSLEDSFFVSGKKWKILFLPSDQYESNHKSALVSISLFSALLFASLILVFLLFMTGRTSTIQRLVDQKTKDLQEALEEARDARAKAEEANQLKSSFLATMSHEIRTPMNGIFGMAELIMHSELSAKQREYLGILIQSSESLLTIINDILDFSKIEAGRMVLEKHPFNPRTLVEDISAFFSPLVREKNMEFIVKISEEIPNSLMGDKHRLQQILSNLLSNALKFTSKGHIFLSLETGPSPQVIRFSVKDTGIGIPKAAQKCIFEKFSQADSSTTRKYGGTGLGLAICKELVHLMGGNIYLKSEKNKGSTFFFDLWFEKTSHEMAPKINETLNLDVLKGVRVLLVDDLPINCQILEDILKTKKMKCASAFSGEEALRKLEEAVHMEHPFQLIIADYLMPEMNGVVLSKTVKESSIIPPTPLILHSSADISLSEEELVENGILAISRKPIRHNDFLTTIADICAHSIARPEAKVQKTKTKTDMESINTKKTIPDLEKGAASPFAQKNILLVEDNFVNQQLMLALLQSFHAQVTLAENGKIALEKLTSGFDLILLDCQMPVMDGYEAAQHMRKRMKSHEIKRIPIIAITANALSGDKEKCLEAGMDDYLSKPIRAQTLLAMGEKWLRSAGP